jgi:OOP family OmpA-OmpF porin
MRFGLLVIFALATIVASSQGLSTKNKKAIELYNEADNFRVHGQYTEALDRLDKALKKDKKFSEAWFRAGLIRKTLHQYPKAIEMYGKGLDVTTDVKKQLPFWFELTEVYQSVGDYEHSLEYANHFLESETQNKTKIDQVSVWKRNIDFARANKTKTTNFQPRELSDTVNAFEMQYFPVLTVDEQQLIFTRLMNISRINENEDLMVSMKNAEGRWGKPVSISDNINSPTGNEGTCAISADGRQIIFAFCAKVDGRCDLFESVKVGDEWTTPVKLGPEVNSSAWEAHPSLSADGRMLFFASNRKGGMGSSDIYVSYKMENNKWTKAENLGDKINTPYGERSPFLHVNGSTLFFSSDGRPGFGGYDIYRSELEDGKWTEPVNFGYPVNTHEHQFSLFITRDGQRGFYSHEDNKKANSSKIIEITIPEELQLRYKSNFVKGIIRDKKTKAPLKARIDLYNINKNELRSFVWSDSITGEYLMVLTQGAEYGLYVSRPGYLFQSLNFNYETETNLVPIALDVELEPVEVGASGVLNNLFFDLNKYELKEKSITELDKVIRFLGENPDIRVEISGHTDNVGTPAYNLQLSQKRAQSVADYLTHHGIDAIRLIQKGYGADKPLKPNDTDENRQINRRIEFKVLR